MKKNANPGKVISEACFKLTLWTTQKVEKFPRSHKFTVGDRLQTLCTDIMLSVVEATYRKDRAVLLKDLQLDLQKLRFLFRLAAEARLLNATAYQFSAREIDGIGRSLGGWQKAHHAQTSR